MAGPEIALIFEDFENPPPAKGSHHHGKEEGLDGGSWYSLITKNLAIYSLSLKFWLIH